MKMKRKHDKKRDETITKNKIINQDECTDDEMFGNV